MTGTIHAHCQKATGLAAAGSILIEIDTDDQQVRDPVGNIVFSGPVTVKLINGEATVEVPASDDVTLSPSGFAYRVTEQLDHVPREKYRVVEFTINDGETKHLADVASGSEVEAVTSWAADVNAVLGRLDDIEAVEGPILAPLIASFVRTVSPLAYGAVGDDTADDTSELQAAITAAASLGAAVDLRGLTYKTTDQIDVPAGSVLRNGTIHCTGTGKKILNVTGDGVTLDRLSVVGRHATATTDAGETGIWAAGASAAAPLRDLTIQRCSVELVGENGIILKWVQGFRIVRCDLGDLGYAAIGTLSAWDGMIAGNRIENVLAGISSNGYGIHLSRSSEITSLSTAPRSANIVVRDNIITDVPWEGIDTHGGENITIANNTVLRCLTGITIGPDDAESDVETYAPLNVKVLGNHIDSGETDGSANNGINFVGATGGSASVPALDYATGVIAGNTIIGHGKQDQNTLGAIYCRNTRALVIHGNHIVEPSCWGVVLYYDNRNVSIVGNTFVDPWSDTNPAGSLCGAIGVRSTNNTGHIGGNTLTDTGARDADEYDNEYGVYSSGTTGTDLAIGANSFGAAISSPAVGDGLALTFHVAVRAANGTAALPSVAFANSTGMGFYRAADNQIGLATSGVRRLRFLDSAILFDEGYNLSLGTATGTMIGTGATHKLGFWGKAPIVQPARAGQLTDSSGGTSGGNTIGAVSDVATAANAIATLAARLNSIEAKLSAAGGGVGLTA